ncbi:MAG: ABC transporter permease [Oscillospiraceae bacterium]|jgi:spermidine/putrescine transport system permease protein|nr:ABC transporter permease [Oscillospiraceae bacterium]
MKNLQAKHRRSLLLNAPHLLWSIIFIVAPLLMVAIYAFRDRSGSWTLDTFRSLFTDKESALNLLFIFRSSLWYALLATAICLLLAYPLAYFMAHAGKRVQRNLMMLITVPMWMNFLICTYSWIAILSERGGLLNLLLARLHLPEQTILYTPKAVVLGMVYNYLPFMILPIYTVLSKLQPSLVEAAQDLGATRWQVLRKITLPLSVPGVISGVTMVFVPSVSTFYISKKLGGNKNQLIGDLIEAKFTTFSDRNGGAALSLILMVMVLLSMVFMRRLSKDDDGAYVAG